MTADGVRKGSVASVAELGLRSAAHSDHAACVFGAIPDQNPSPTRFRREWPTHMIPPVGAVDMRRRNGG